MISINFEAIQSYKDNLQVTKVSSNNENIQSHAEAIITL